MLYHGLLRVAAAVPQLRVGDCAFNAAQILALLERAQAAGVEIAVFPELCLTGYTCNDLFHQDVLLRSALAALLELAEKGGKVYQGLAAVGLPVFVDDHVFNCAAVFSGGRVLGFVPKSHLPNYKEFYDERYFFAATKSHQTGIYVGHDCHAPFGPNHLFAARGDVNVVVGVEICEDLWVPNPPSSEQALCGANVLLNLSASNEVIGKAAYRRELVSSQSGRCIAAYVYASSGVHESTTDLVFGGHCLIAENGSILAESTRFDREANLLVHDIDLGRLRADRCARDHVRCYPVHR